MLLIMIKTEKSPKFLQKISKTPKNLPLQGCFAIFSMIGGFGLPSLAILDHI